MYQALRSGVFISGVLLLLAGIGISINFFLRSKEIEIPGVIMIIVGVILAFSGWKRSRNN
ncbi:MULTISPECIES: hypothetical protein [unclassified Pseudomonas]|uniref:hypothetical protein n=1 Tax=unclassified Pseudomonas TaxID=196821 RepID=UPI00092FDB28|nr:MULTISPECIES: hypothetical protein [unclassified Pseudomonas]